MLDVTVELGQFVGNLGQEAIQSVLADIAESARNHWIGLADREFHTTRRDYISGIQTVEMRPGVAIITLLGMLPNALENGMPEINMRDTLLGANVPIGSPGKRLSIRADGTVGFYRAIPFRHSTPRSSGTVAPQMGSAYASHSAVMNSKKLGEEIYGKAKRLKPTTSQPGGEVMYGGRLKAGLAPKLRPYHKTDIYAGMIKESKTYQAATQSQYTTFRTISTRVADGWIRPATVGRNLSAEVGEFVAKLAPQAFEAYVSRLNG